jgi:hypothetical protein
MQQNTVTSQDKFTLNKEQLVMQQPVGGIDLKKLKK